MPCALALQRAFGLGDHFLEQVARALDVADLAELLGQFELARQRVAVGGRGRPGRRTDAEVAEVQRIVGQRRRCRADRRRWRRRPATTGRRGRSPVAARRQRCGSAGAARGRRGAGPGSCWARRPPVRSPASGCRDALAAGPERQGGLVRRHRRLDGLARCGRSSSRSSPMPPSSVASGAGSKAGGSGWRGVRHRRCPQRFHRLALGAQHLAGPAAGLVQRVVGVDAQTQFLRLRPVLAFTPRQAVHLRGQQFEALGVAPLGVDLEQLGADGHALRRGAHGLLQDFLGLQVAPVGQVDVGLGHRIDIADGVELAQRIAHRRRAAGGGVGGGLAGVDALAAAGAEEGIGLQPAFQERGFAGRPAHAPAQAPQAEAGQQRHQHAGTGQQQRVVQQRVEQAAFGRRRRGVGGGGRPHGGWRGRLGRPRPARPARA